MNELDETGICDRCGKERHVEEIPIHGYCEWLCEACYHADREREAADNAERIGEREVERDDSY